MEMFGGALGYSAVFWGAIVCFVLIGSYFRYKTRESEHRMLERLAEKGQQISPDLLANIGRDGNGQRGGGLRGGLILMAIGFGLAVFFWAMNGGGGMFHNEGVPNWLPVIGVIPFMIGLALFLSSLFEKRPPN
jgi:hypothetical protein